MSDQEYTPETLRALFTDLDWNAESQYAVRWLAARVLPHADAWRKQLEAAKAREEAGNLMAECLRSMDGVDTQGPILAATIHFLLRDDVRAAVDKWQAASEPPGTARQSLGEEGT